MRAPAEVNGSDGQLRVETLSAETSLFFLSQDISARAQLEDGGAIATGSGRKVLLVYPTGHARKPLQRSPGRILPGSHPTAERKSELPPRFLSRSVSNERLFQPPHQRPIFKDIVRRSVEIAVGGRSLQQTVANQAGQGPRIKVGGGNKRLQRLRPAQRDFHQHLSTQIGQTALHVFVNTAGHLTPDLLSKRTFGGRQSVAPQHHPASQQRRRTSPTRTCPNPPHR